MGGSSADSWIRAEAYGVYAWDIDNFTNEGTITVTSSVDNSNATWDIWAWTYGVDAGSIGNFTNEGNITVTSSVDNSNATSGYIGAYACGVYVGNIGNFSNLGTINVTAIATNGNAEAFGVEVASVGNFTNKGTINVFVTGSSVEAYGVSIENLIGNLVNNGNILVSAISNGTASSIEGIDVGVGDNGSIENNGQITISTRAINSLYDIYGIYAYFDSDGSLVNNGNISVSATSEDGYSEYVYGIYYYGNANINFFNSGNIKVSVVSSNSTGSGNYYIDEVYGVEGLSSGGSFVNTGNIEVSADARNGGYALDYVYGVYLDEIDSFLNNGTIKVSALLGDNPGYGSNSSIDLYDVYGVYLDSSIRDFINNGNILVNATAGTGYGGDYYWSDIYVDDIYGVYLEGNANNFTNNGTIFVNAQAGNSEGYNTYVEIYDAYGVYIDGYVDNFINPGNITVMAKVGDSNGFYYGRTYIVDVYGVYVNEEVNSFTNLGNIAINAKVGNANGETTYAYIRDVSGVYIDGASDTFTNKGNIVVSATLGNAIGEDSSVYSYSISGVEIWSNVGNFTNEGNIRVQVSAGDASGATGNNSTVSINSVSALIFEGGIGTVANSGNLITNVKAGANAEIGDIAGLLVSGSDGGNIINSGNIYVNIDAPDANTVDRVAGIFVIDSNDINLTNTGAIYLSTNKPNSNIRTLWLETSDVTLFDKFAITLGMPGIDPEMRPIYVGSGSELTLNATLIARGDSRNLKLGVPYYLIENNGTVEGEWLGLERGYANPAISVSWYDPTQLGENSSVIFNYIPTATSEAEESNIAPIMGALGTDYIIIPDLINMISFTSPSSPTGIFTRFMKGGVMYASVGASDAGTSGLSSLNMERGWIWFTPYYIWVNADDLGFDVDSYGFTMGIGGRVSERLAGDIFVSYFNNDVDFSVMGADKDDIDYFAGGFNLVYKVTPWYVRMTGLGYTAEHDYKGYTGLNFDLKEKADYRSYGGVLEVLGGVIKGNKVKVIPEIGLRYGYYKTKDFWTEVSVNPGLNRKYEPDELNVFHLIGGLMILGEYKKGDESEIRLFGRIRLEQAISDNDISTITYAPNQPKYQLERGIADTNCVVQGGMNWNYKKRWNFELSGIADLNADYSAYGGRFLIRYNF